MVLRWVWSGCSTPRKECVRKPSHGAQPGLQERQHRPRKAGAWRGTPKGLGQLGQLALWTPELCEQQRHLGIHWKCSFLPREMPIPESKGINSFWDSARKFEFNFLPISNTKGMLTQNRNRIMGSQLTAQEEPCPLPCSAAPQAPALWNKGCPGSFPWLSRRTFLHGTCPAPGTALVSLTEIHLWHCWDLQTCSSDKGAQEFQRKKRFWILSGFVISVVKRDHCTKFSVRKNLKRNNNYKKKSPKSSGWDSDLWRGQNIWDLRKWKLCCYLFTWHN